MSNLVDSPRWAHLVCGYTRIKAKPLQIPNDIINICLMFYIPSGIESQKVEGELFQFYQDYEIKNTNNKNKPYFRLKESESLK